MIIESVKEKVNDAPLADTTIEEKDKPIAVNDPVPIVPAVSAVAPIASSGV